jgi:hypothetical protein
LATRHFLQPQKLVLKFAKNADGMSVQICILKAFTRHERGVKLQEVQFHGDHAGMRDTDLSNFWNDTSHGGASFFGNIAMRKILLALGLVLGSMMFLSAHVVADEATQQGLKTRSGHEMGVSISNYNYWESNDSVNLSGGLYGLEYERTQAFSDFFVMGDLQYKKGNLSYTSQSSGSLSNLSNYYYELRGLIGKDFSWSSGNLSPYSGLGYRYLYDDNRGISTTGAAGYQREISYLYIPFGTIYRISLTNAILETRVEYDYLIKGKVNTHLSDSVGFNSITANSDVTNNQTSGWGIRLSTSYQEKSWALTPYFNYWFVQNSDVTSTTKIQGGLSSTAGVFEPTNRTVEYGLKGSYKF